jgi:hypothetical protein
MLVPRRALRLFWLAILSVAAVFFSDLVSDSLRTTLGLYWAPTTKAPPACRPVDGSIELDGAQKPLVKSAPLQRHQYRRDGLLEVNEDGPHPIYELMARAEAAWQEKLASASKTLPEAVREYRRRYHRAPPRGFDAWYVALPNCDWDFTLIFTCRSGGTML